MRLFISYARKDKRRIQSLIETLRDGGHEPFFDQYLTGGRDWQAQLSEEIDSCDVFVAVLTPNSAASEWCQWELARAIELGKPVVPVMLRRVPISRTIARIMAVDFTGGASSGSVARLITAVNRAEVVIPPEQAPDAPINPAGSPSHAAVAAGRGLPIWLIGIVVVLLIVGGAVVVLANRSPDNPPPALTDEMTPVAQADTATATPPRTETPAAITTPTSEATIRSAPTLTNTPSAIDIYLQGKFLQDRGELEQAIDR